MPSGLWLAPGTRSGVNPNASDVGMAGNGTGIVGLPSNFDGTQAITGRFAGTNLQDVLAYYPGTGGASIFLGRNDGSALTPTGDDVQSLDPSILTEDSPTGTDKPTMVANAGTASGQTSGFMDLIAINGDPDNGYHLTYHTNGGAPTGYGMAYTLVTPTPDLTLDWNNWTIATAQRPSGSTDMFLWNKTTGALVLWSAIAFATDDDGDNTLTYTPYTLADGTSTTFQKSSTAALQAADVNGDGNPDLRTTTANKVSTLWLVTNLVGTTGVITAQPAQTLIVPVRTWPLNDTDSGIATSARELIGGHTAAATTGNASWHNGDLFNPDVTFDPANRSAMNSNIVVAPNSDFTVSFWAKPMAYSGNIISQDGTNGTFFKIWPSTDTTWHFGMEKNDYPFTTATWDEAISAPNTDKLGLWYHITATYQNSTKKMTLYIGNTQAGTATRTGTWPAPGETPTIKLQFGTMKTGSGSWDWFYKGELANVQMWDTVAPPALS